MKRSIVIIACLLFFVSGSYAKFKTPAYQQRLVNDYIGLLNNSDKETLEQSLRDFEAKSSIEIAVVILDDLDGIEAADAATQIGEAWGVGKKELDNGIVFLVVKYKRSALDKLFSAKTGDVFIATGYGLEPYLTDMGAGKLLDKYFIPSVKHGDFTKAIKETVAGIIAELGDDAWQQREELRLQKEAERRETLKAIGGILASLVGLAGITGMIIALCKWIRRKWEAYRKRKKLRKEFKAAFNLWNELQKKFCSQCKDQEWDFKDYPTWAKSEYKQAKAKMTEIAERGYDLNEGFSNQLKKDLVKAEKDLNELKAINQKLPTWEASVKKIEGEIQRYKDEAPKKVAQAEKDLQGFKTEYEKQQKADFFLTDYPQKHATLKSSLDQIKGLEGKNQDREIVEQTSALIQKISGGITLLSTFLALPKSNQQNLGTIKSFQEKLPDLKEKAMKSLQSLKQHPKENWEEVESNLLKLATLEGKMNNLVGKAEEDNSMSVQHFDEAKEGLDEASKHIHTIQEYCSAPDKKLGEIATAKTKIEELLKTLPAEIAKAQGKIRNGGSDIESSTKKLLTDAESKFHQGEQLAGNNLVNWIILFTLLTSALQLARKAYQFAQSDIDDAEEKREAARKAKREADVAQQRSHSQYYSSHSHHSGGGIRTGGGHFGGGGAGRRF
ncbi:MAG: TPM domain-containing protein [Candidatus Peribacteria bacterium]|jgi:uncharacterized membrane protein YgcG|nr:TPM domain-containing protein [Candidatus Peribacteria bacterium]